MVANSARYGRQKLLPSEETAAAGKQWHPALRATLLSLAAVLLLFLALIGVEAGHLFLYTLPSPDQAQQARILDEALILKGPDSVRLLDISDDGARVGVDGRLGIDPDRALEIWLGNARSIGWWKRRDRSIIEWALSKVGGVKIELSQLAISEPDWSLDLDEKSLDLLPPSKNKIVGTRSIDSLSLSPKPRRLLSFDVEPLLVPLPELLHTTSAGADDNDDDDPIFGRNSSRRARLELRTLNLTLLFKPLVPAPDLVQFGKRAIKHGNVTLDIKVNKISVKGVTKREVFGVGSSTFSSSWIPGLISLNQNKIVKRVRQVLPKFDMGNSTSGLLNLTRYDFFEIKDGQNGKDQQAAIANKSLGIHAFAEAKNPLGDLLKGSIRYKLPFGIYLPFENKSGVRGSESPHANGSKPVDKVLLAVVASDPFELDGRKEIKLELQGRVVPPPKDALGSTSNSDPEISEHLVRASVHQHAFATDVKAPSGDVGSLESPNEAALGNFLSRFLRGDPNTVYVRGGSPFDTPQDPNVPGSGSPDLPDWLSSILGVLDVPISFPGSKVTDLIKNVTIQDLKIRTHPWSQDKLTFSGTVVGELGLPAELAAVVVEIKYLWPDILVYNGKPPSMRLRRGDDWEDPPDDGGDDEDDDGDDAADRRKSSEGDDDETPPLPDPLPKGAFGRVRPRTWANATTTLDRSDPANPRKILRSELIDVPFRVLPGRGKAFRDFLWKLITGEGAETGIEGSSKVKIEASGLGELAISGLPVVGDFIVGKRGEETTAVAAGQLPPSSLS